MGKWKDRLAEAIAGGLAGLIIVSLFVIYHARLADVDAAAWLGFAGSLFGAVLAAAVAVGIYRAGIEYRHRNDIRILKSALSKLDNACQAMKVWDFQNLPQDWQAILLEYANGLELLQFVLKRGEIRDEALWLDLLNIEAILRDNSHAPKWEKFRLIAHMSDTPGRSTLESHAGALQYAISRVKAPLDAARKGLN